MARRRSARGPGQRLVCVVEGHGEVEAVPALCSRIRDFLEAWTWFVDPDPVRQPRSRLVDQGVPSPRRPAPGDGLRRAVELAAVRADAVLVLCDADDDCPAVWGPSATAVVTARCSGGAVMVVREYEAWLLHSKIGATDARGRPVDSIRDARGALRSLIPGYKSTTHQAHLTRRIPIEGLRASSASFDKLVRTLARIFGVNAPPIR
ncbi:MAG: DUF4276 family protein [Polyangiaceae bacterium]|nr:DUF4276 family protein [Polyangiaceae bacterium]